jgi:AcrR family transcriptional regulator
MASTDTSSTSPSRSATCIATADFPDAVGATMATGVGERGWETFRMEPHCQSPSSRPDHPVSKATQQGRRNTGAAGSSRTASPKGPTLRPVHEEADGSDDVAVDGRAARRTRNRSTVIDAALALYDERRYPFTLHDVAERSGVSVRSIYRYFPNVDELVQAAAATRMQVLGDLIEVFEPGETHLSDRIERLLDSRIALLERVDPIRALDEITARSTDDAVRRTRRFVQERLREQFETVFRPELDGLSDDRRRHITVTFESLMLPAAIVYRRDHLGMTIEESAAMLTDVLHLLFG